MNGKTHHDLCNLQFPAHIFFAWSKCTKNRLTIKTTISKGLKEYSLFINGFDKNYDARFSLFYVKKFSYYFIQHSEQSSNLSHIILIECKSAESYIRLLSKLASEIATTNFP